jgi:hypothetical protein
MSISGESYLDTTVWHELEKPTIDLRELAVGSKVAIVLAEGEDAQRQARLKLRFKSPPTDDEPGKFEVVEAELDAETIRLNAEAEMSLPEQMGGEIWVNFACTYRRGYMPPITMGQNDAISPGRHLFMWIPAPTADSPTRGIKYHAEVLSAQVV